MYVSIVSNTVVNTESAVCKTESMILPELSSEFAGNGTDPSRTPSRRRPTTLNNPSALPQNSDAGGL